MQFRQISAQASRKRRLSVFLAAGAFALAGFGTQAQAQEAAQAEGDNDLGSWVKVCVEEPTLEDQEVCLVTQEARADTGEFIAAVTVGTLVEEDQKILRAMLPIGSILPPGFAVQIDEAEPQQATYTQCLPQACYGEMAIDSDYVDELKAGGNLILYWIDHEGEQRGLGFTLIGFTDAYEGPPIDTEQLAQQRQQLQDELQRRAADARQRLLEQQGGQEAAPTE